MIEEVVMSPQRWRDAWLWYRGSPHQSDAVDLLYLHLRQLPGGDCLLSESAEWFRAYRDRDKLLHSAMFTEGE